MYQSIVLLAVFFYLVLLFSMARWGDKRQFVETSWVRHPVVYALALGVYCTSWTFYGLVGTASEKGWNFFPILLGPILLFTLGFPILERIYTLCRQEHIHSIADFIASRYGKRQGVAATVSVVVLLATIPYIALQLKAVSDTLLLTVGKNFLVSQDLTFVIGLFMIAFALAFGAKRLDMSGYHSGLMSAIALESVVKLLALIVIAASSAIYFFDFTIPLDQSDAAIEKTPAFFQSITWPRFLVETLLSCCAVFCLPRMFHVTFVECLSKEHLQKSRWFFVAYIILIALCVVLIASVGNQVFFGQPNVSGDSYVIALPLAQGSFGLGVVAFLGGFSAATAMIIVATVTLSQMLSNDVVLPLLMRHKKHQKTRADFSRSLIFARRLTVCFVVLAAYFYQSVLAENVALTSIGLIAFALVVQLAPAILFGLYWRKGNAHGLYAGLIVGVSLWFYTLMIPLLVDAGLLSRAIVENGFFGVSWLRPGYLFNLTFSDSFTRGVVLSLSANILFYCWYSLTSSEKLGDRLQSAAFTNLEQGKYDHYQDVDLNDLRALLVEFLGQVSTDKLFSSVDLKKNTDSKHQLVEQAQKSLAAIVGVASSQSMVESLYSGKAIAVEEVVNLFGETARALRFNQEVLSASFENISSGISVVDANLQLIAWNQRYEDMFQYPEDLLQVGLHVSDIMRLNGERGLLGDGSVDDLICKRLSYMTSGKIYRVVRFHQEVGMVIEIKGRPLPNGGYVTTYDDITEFINTQKNLEDANANLERRVLERTQEIEEVNSNLLQEIKQRISVEEALREAKKMADDANASKTQFLALASHDIMQPLNAANLYASALLDHHGQLIKDVNIVKQLQAAIANTESIISTLLEVSKVDGGVLQPKFNSFCLDEMLSSIITEATVQLPDTLSLKYSKTSLYVYSDRHHLQRIVQNFVSNAIKYTSKGKILVGCRRVQQEGVPSVEICVIDTGIGISGSEKGLIFDDFYRVDMPVHQGSIPGVGLGLSVVTRFSELLNHSVRCRSELHKGSCFSIVVPLSHSQDKVGVSSLSLPKLDALQGMLVVYVDDEPPNLLATAALLERWECQTVSINTVAAARQYAEDQLIPHVLLMDFQLDESDVTGVSLAAELVDAWEARCGYRIPVCIISAASDATLPQQVKAVGFEFLRKPLKPGRLRALLTQLKERGDENHFL